MENSKVNVTLPENFDPANPVTIVYREGNAAPNKEKRTLFVGGIITAIAEFVVKNNYQPTPEQNKELVLFSIHPDHAFLSIESDRMTVPGEGDFKIESKLVANPDLAAFGINNDIFFNAKDLKKLVRKYAHLFPDPSIAATLLQNLNNFEAKFETHIKKADDRQGNSEDLVKQAIKFTQGEMPKAFDLVAPIYDNTDPVPLTLDIEIEKRGNEAVFGFYCLTYEVIRRDVAETTILQEVQTLKDKFVCIEQA